VARRNNGWDELSRPIAELLRYPAASMMLIISVRVRSRPAARLTITRYRSGATTPPGGCHRPSLVGVHPTAVNAAVRSRLTTDSGCGNAGAGDRGGKCRQVQLADRR